MKRIYERLILECSLYGVVILSCNHRKKHFASSSFFIDKAPTDSATNPGTDSVTDSVTDPATDPVTQPTTDPSPAPNGGDSQGNGCGSVIGVSAAALVLTALAAAFVCKKKD